MWRLRSASIRSSSPAWARTRRNAAAFWASITPDILPGLAPVSASATTRAERGDVHCAFCALRAAPSGRARPYSGLTPAPTMCAAHHCSPTLSPGAWRGSAAPARNVPGMLCAAQVILRWAPGSCAAHNITASVASRLGTPPINPPGPARPRQCSATSPATLDATSGATCPPIPRRDTPWARALRPAKTALNGRGATNADSPICLVPCRVLTCATARRAPGFGYTSSRTGDMVRNIRHHGGMQHGTQHAAQQDMQHGEAHTFAHAGCRCCAPLRLVTRIAHFVCRRRAACIYGAVVEHGGYALGCAAPVRRVWAAL